MYTYRGSVLYRTHAQRAEERVAAQREATASSTRGRGAATAVKRECNCEHEHTYPIDAHRPGETLIIQTNQTNRTYSEKERS